ncbi:MAG: hypothetical protein AAF485_19325, partial [Chloroflexota bacterium]
MRRLREIYPNELVVISVHSGKFPSEKSTANIREAVMRHGIHHPVINDADFQVWQAYTIRAWPTIVLIDPAGKVVDTQPGEILAETYQEKIEALIAAFDAINLLDRTPIDFEPEISQEPIRPLNYPSKVLLGPDNLLYIADTGHHRILEVSLKMSQFTGGIQRVFGQGQPGFQDGAAEEAQFHDPHGMALNGSTLYIADTENHAIRAIDLKEGSVRTVAGTGKKAHAQLQLDKPTKTPLRSPWALLTEDEVVFIAMAGSHQIWVLLKEQQLGPFFGNGQEALVDGPQMESSFNQPSDLSLGMGHIFVADSEASAIRAISLTETPTVITLIGQGLFEFGDNDGVGSAVRLQHPTGLVYHNGLVYIADSYNHKIKTLDPTQGRVTTVIGTGDAGYVDGSFEEAHLFEPEGVAAMDDYLFIADTNNHAIRIAHLPTQSVHTLALKALDQLHPPKHHPSVHQLEAINVPSGDVKFNLHIELPAGYKRNEEAPLSLQIDKNGVP